LETFDFFMFSPFKKAVIFSLEKRTYVDLRALPILVSGAFSENVQREVEEACATDVVCGV
jgi:hypothetical protein